MNTKKSKPKALGKKPILDEDEFDPKYCKMRTSIMLDLEIIDGFKELAKKKGTKYQSLMRDTLRDALDNSKYVELEERLTKVEKVLAKKRA